MPVHRHPVASGRKGSVLSGIPLDAALIERLAKTYRLVRAQDVRLAELFYTKLFAAAPGLRGMFSTDINVQARKLTLALDMIVSNLSAPEENAAMLAAMGRRHADYGAKPEHYAVVVELLVESMGELLGKAADANALQEWRMALTLVSRQMIEAAEAGTNGTANQGTATPAE